MRIPSAPRGSLRAESGRPANVQGIGFLANNHPSCGFTHPHCRMTRPPVQFTRRDRVVASEVTVRESLAQLLLKTW